MDLTFFRYLFVYDDQQKRLIYAYQKLEQKCHLKLKTVVYILRHLAKVLFLLFNLYFTIYPAAHLANFSNLIAT